LLYFQIKHLTNEISDEKLKDLLNKTLKLWNSNEGRKLRKEARIVYYCHKGFLNRLSVITWYFGDGVCPHDKSLDIGIAMSIHDYVLNYINNYLSKLYNVHRVFSGSGLSQIKYIVCPAKKYVIEDIISYAKRIPKILYPRKLRKLINVHSHVNPCISMKKNTEIELYGIRLTLKKREVGRGYVLCRSSTSIDRLIEIKKVLEENGVNSSIHKSGSNNYELYIPVEETKRILKQIGLEYLIESNKLPKIQEITSILSKYKFKWNVRIEAGVNGSGYRYQSECVEFELENSGVASMLAEELNHIGISTRRKKGSRKVLICRGEHRELIKKALVKAIP